MLSTQYAAGPNSAIIPKCRRIGSSEWRLGHLERDIAAMADHFCADLDQEIVEIVGQRMKVEPHSVGREPSP
jgi:hypothetical protein